MLITPKTLDDARSLIENTVMNKGSNDTWLNKLGLHGLQEAINNFNKVCEGLKSISNAVGSTCDYISKCFTEPRFFIENLQSIAPGILVVVLGILIVLKVLGFKDTTKWIYFYIVIAIVIAGL